MADRPCSRASTFPDQSVWPSNGPDGQRVLVLDQRGILCLTLPYPVAGFNFHARGPVVVGLHHLRFIEREEDPLAVAPTISDQAELHLVEFVRRMKQFGIIR